MNSSRSAGRQPLRQTIARQLHRVGEVQRESAHAIRAFATEYFSCIRRFKCARRLPKGSTRRPPRGEMEQDGEDIRRSGRSSFDLFRADGRVARRRAWRRESHDCWSRVRKRFDLALTTARVDEVAGRNRWSARARRTVRAGSALGVRRRVSERLPRQTILFFFSSRHPNGGNCASGLFELDPDVQRPAARRAAARLQSPSRRGSERMVVTRPLANQEVRPCGAPSGTNRRLLPEVIPNRATAQAKATLTCVNIAHARQL